MYIMHDACVTLSVCAADVDSDVRDSLAALNDTYA